jgi:hypothetical protein
MNALASTAIPRPAGIIAPPDPGVPALRLEIAGEAARLIADGGLDYGSAKRKAISELLDGRPAPRGIMPDNHEIDRALAEHLDLFDPEHAGRVARMRRVALAFMRPFSDSHPHLTGAVWKGIVAEHAPIHIQLFQDDGKDIALRLLNDGIEFDVDEIDHFRDAGRTRVQTLQMHWRNEPLMVSLYRHDDLRGALKGYPAERGGIAEVERLLDATPRVMGQPAPVASRAHGDDFQDTLS